MEDLGDFSIPPMPMRLGNVRRTNELFDLMGNEGFSDIDDDGSLSLLTGTTCFFVNLFIRSVT